MFTIVDAFRAGSLTVITLNKKWDFSDLTHKKALINGVETDYGFTHKQDWITLKTSVDPKVFIGKSFEFIA